MPKVSVIMGVYNSKDYKQIKKSVDSIINQSYTDWELIICNDGSGYETTKLLECVEKLDERIKVIGYKENQGLAYALNCCIENASGDYIARQDDDDFSHILRLEKQVKFLNENDDINIVGTLAEKFDDTGILGTYLVPEKPNCKDFRWISPFIHPTVMIRAKDLRNVEGYRVSVDTIKGQDYDLFMRMYAKGFKGVNLQEILYSYRLVSGGYKKRNFKIRISEVKIRSNGFKALGIFWSSLPYVLKPMILGMIPLKILNYIRNKKED